MTMAFYAILMLAVSQIHGHLVHYHTSCSYLGMPVWSGACSIFNLAVSPTMCVRTIFDGEATLTYFNVWCTTCDEEVRIVTLAVPRRIAVDDKIVAAGEKPSRGTSRPE